MCRLLSGRVDESNANNCADARPSIRNRLNVSLTTELCFILIRCGLADPRKYQPTSVFGISGSPPNAKEGE